VRRSHTRRTRTPRGLLGRDCTSGQVLLRFSHFTLHTPHLTPHTHLSLWPYPLKTTTADQRIAVWSDSCDVAVDKRKPLAAAILLLCWPEMFRRTCSDCFKRRKSCIPVCGAGGSLDAESVKFIPITSQLLVRARGKINIMTERLM
jgi:hypothetical protein